MNELLVVWWGDPSDELRIRKLLIGVPFVEFSPGTLEANWVFEGAKPIATKNQRTGPLLARKQDGGIVDAEWNPDMLAFCRLSLPVLDQKSNDELLEDLGKAGEHRGGNGIIYADDGDD